MFLLDGEARIVLLRGPLQKEQQTSLSRGGFWCVVRIYSKHGGSLCPCVYLSLDHYCRSCQWLQNLSVTTILAYRPQSEKEVTENADIYIVVVHSF